MQLIKPSEISGQIMTLMEEADQKAILISPYFKISKWYKLVNRLNELKNRKIDVEIYVRENEQDSINEVKNMGFQPITVPHLHTKLYLNEKVAIISSMNLLLSSDTSSIDIAMKTENDREYKELFDYYTRYISNKAANSKNTGYKDWKEELYKQLRSELGDKVQIHELANKLQISTRNRYEAFIERGKQELHISGILSGKEFDYARSTKQAMATKKIRIQLQPGGKGYYDTAWGIKDGIKSSYIHELNKLDEREIVECIVEFITRIEQLKDFVRKQ